MRFLLDVERASPALHKDNSPSANAIPTSSPSASPSPSSLSSSPLVSSATPAPPQTPSSDNVATPGPEFPPPWNICWEKIKRPADAAFSGAPLVWTYFLLGKDMLQSPDTGRRQTLRQLIGGLGLPSGAVRFWPMAVPASSRYDVKIGLFWRGLKALGAKTVCCFGTECRSIIARELHLSLNANTQVAQYRSGRFVFLPDLDSVGADPAMFAAALSILREHALHP